MQDADILVQHDIEELFDYPAPASLMRGPGDHRRDEVLAASSYFHPDGTLRGGTNAGVVVLARLRPKATRGGFCRAA